MINATKITKYFTADLPTRHSCAGRNLSSLTNNPPPIRRQTSGVTLIELLLIVAILSVAAAIGLPTVWQNTGKRADMKTVQGLASDIEYVRSMALMDMPGFANAQFTASESKYKVATLTRELTGNYQISNNATLNFTSSGRLLSDDVTINIKRKTGGSDIAHVTVASSGYITWDMP